MRRSHFTVSYLSHEMQYLSRSFPSLTAARNWADWLKGQTWVVSTTIYRGQAGGEVVE
jgi:hypothetical protein